MKDPYWLGEDCCIDRAALLGIVRNGGNLILFLRGSRPITVTDEFTAEELEKLTINGAPAPRT